MLSVYVLTITLITLTATQLYISVIYFSLYTIIVQKRWNNPIIVFMEAGPSACTHKVFTTTPFTVIWVLDKSHPVGVAY